MRLELDYALRSSFPSPVMMAAIALAALLLFYEAWNFQKLQDELSGLQLRIADMAVPAQPARPMTKQELETLSPRVSDANSVLAELGIDWNGLLNGLESSASPDAVLLEIKPEAAKGQILLKGEARNLPALMVYVRRLELNAPLVDVTVQEHEVVTDDARKPVRFLIKALWGSAK